MTAWAEAYRSLRLEKYRTEAETLAETLKERYQDAIKWSDFLSGTADFSGLSYCINVFKLKERKKE